MGLEIERKYKIIEVPSDLKVIQKQDIRQGYLDTGVDNFELRVRHSDSNFYITCKSGSGAIREEMEIPISENLFNSLWPLTKGKRIRKRRFEVMYGKHTIEIDFYKDRADALIVAEVEFANDEDYQNFVPPSWFSDEITNDPEYKNQNLAE